MRGKGMSKFVVSISTVLILLTGCSAKPSLELMGASVEIRDDRLGGTEIMSGESKGEIIQPVSLSYDFVLKNIGKSTLGSAEKMNTETYEFEDGIKIVIKPNKELQDVSKEVMGFNILNEEKREQAHLGIVKQISSILEPNQEGEYSLNFELGALEDNPELKKAPSQEQLDKLKRSALDATLVILVEDEEIARFDLNNLE
ncbi:hypothetical protein [Peribacillus loiseleuriae]|uniref:Lipoprotein n=1 Tax=Peribacillus loiseleuriae TaxID=1679170 RepID=A0A0K9GU84_9BACI|nr:hypothetical protein [Peribacillus loiseleuriae]KMY50183.1 lipoprotein [Peribacillus loiseleuriae]